MDDQFSDQSCVPPLTAIILAGGDSRRMGQDKALLDWQGQPLLGHMGEIALAVCQPAESGIPSARPAVWVVTPRVERYQPLLPPGCECLRERRSLPAMTVPGSGGNCSPGPLVAFAQGLAVVETEWVLLLACDLPHLSVAGLRRAAARLARQSADTLACLPAMPLAQRRKKTARLGRRLPCWEPLCGFYRRRCGGSLERAIAQGERSFQGWLAQIPVAPLRLGDPGQLKNCNTPAEWEAAQISEISTRSTLSPI